jgi:hypothetical protein
MTFNVIIGYYYDIKDVIHNKDEKNYVRKITKFFINMIKSKVHLVWTNLAYAYLDCLMKQFEIFEILFSILKIEYIMPKTSYKVND